MFKYVNVDPPEDGEAIIPQRFESATTEVRKMDSLEIDWDLLRETIKDRLNLDDQWEWVNIGPPDEHGYWSFHMPGGAEVAIEPGFFGYVNIAVYNDNGILLMPKKLRVVLP